MARRPRRATITVDDINGAGIDTSGATGGDGSGNDDNGAGSGGPDFIDPGAVGNLGNEGGGSGWTSGGYSSGDSGDAKPRRKYTRRARAAKGQALPVDVLAAILLSSHAMLAGVTKTAELALSEAEANSLALALSTVNSFYNVAVAEKTLAWINLAMVAGGVYGSRIVAIRMNRTARRARDVSPERPPTSSAAGETEPAPTMQPVSTTDAYGAIPADFMPGFN